MGLIQAFKGALSGTLADQWKDFYTFPRVSDTTVFAPAVRDGVGSGARGVNVKGSSNVISNGSKIVLPEGYALVLTQDGGITNFAAEAGGYIFDTDEAQSFTIFDNNGILSSTLKPAFERFKFAGRESVEQNAFYVNLKEIPGNRFGTQGPIYWDDAYMNAQVGAVARGTYSFRIVDPILFINNLLPASYYTGAGQVFDMGQPSPINDQLFSEFVGSLAQAFSIYTNDPDKDNRMTKIQSDSLGLAKAVSQALEENYSWKSAKGIEVSAVAVMALDYDEDTQELMSDVKRADALGGNRMQSSYMQNLGKGIRAAGETGGGADMGMLAFGANAGASMGAGMFPGQNQEEKVDPTEELLKYKQLLDAEAITQEEYDQLKKRLLDL